MAAEIDCPDVDRLRQLMLGQIPAGDAESLGDHLLHCARCAETVHGLDATDSLVNDARAGACVSANPESNFIANLITRLQHLHSPQSIAGSDATAATAATEQIGTQIGPYKLLQVVGEGGMGTVYMAEQSEPLERIVALKVIKAGMDSRQVLARFEAERQTLALMDHANIAKVLDAGTTKSGQPYFVMELVQGISITKYSDEQHLSVKERLGLFIPVCQAIQHAHQKGIIHRDIKPSNVLVAQYDGQPMPKVIDFGVAKATAQKLAERTVFTEFGQLVGTLEYMSPEQADLNQLDIDTRSDIYSLGVLLYELLTGSTPFDRKRLQSVAFDEMLRIIREEEPEMVSVRLAKTRSAVRGQVRSAEFRMGTGSKSSIFRSLFTPHFALRIPHLIELDWIVLKCLEKDRDRRYETANGLAMELQRYLHDEPVLACPPSAMYRLRKFARRNKTGLAITSLILLFIVLLGGGIGWLVRDREAQRTAFEQKIARDQATRQAKLAEEVQLALQEAQTLGDRAMVLVDDNPYQWEATLAAALAASKRAEALADPDRGALDPAILQRLATLRARLEADEQDREFVAQIDTVRLEAAQVDLERSRFKTNEQSFKIKALFQTRGIEFGVTSPEQVVAWMHIRPEPIRKHVIEALDIWLARLVGAAAETVDERQWLTAVLQAADDDAWPTQVRRALLAEDAKALESLVREVQPAQHPVAFLLLLANRLPPELGATKLSLLKQIQSSYPGDFWANEDYGLALQNANPPNWAAAVRFYTAAAALRPENPGAQLNLGNALNETRDLDGALAAVRKALEVAPNYATAYNNLGKALLAKGDIAGAIAAFGEAIRLDPKYATPHNGLGNALRAKGDLDRAIAAFREAMRLDPKYATPHNGLGNVLQAKGDLDGAIAAFREAIRLDVKYANAHNGVGSALKDKGDLDGAIAAFREALRLDLKNAKSHYNLGVALQAKDDLDGAIAAYREAIRLDPKFALVHNGLGSALWKKGDLDGAIIAYREAIHLDPKFAYLHNGLGNALRAKGDPDGAIAAYEKAIELEPDYANARNSLVAAYDNIARVRSTEGKLDEAIAAYRKTIELKPNFASAHAKLGDLLREQGKVEEAIVACRKAVELDPNVPLFHVCLGNVLREQGEQEEAIKEYRKAIDLKPNDDWAYFALGNALTDLGKLDEAITAYRKAVAINPKHDAAHRDLGNRQLTKGDVEGAARSFRTALALNPRSALAHSSMGNLFMVKGDVEGAVSQYRTAIDIDAKFAVAYASLGNALMAKGDVEGAISRYRTAIELTPKWVDCSSLERWKAAFERLRQSMALRQGSNSFDEFFLAMAYWKLGDKEQARTWYHRAVQWMETNRSMLAKDPVALHRFRSEAEEVLGLKE